MITSFLSKKSVRLSLVIAAVLALMLTISASMQGPEGAQREIDGGNLREVQAPTGTEAVNKPNLSFIDSPTPYCYQPDPAQDVCYINWASISVGAAPASMDVMTVTLDAIGPVARYQGFFQDTMTITHQMHGRGFQVACGAPGDGGRAQLGSAYAWSIQAEDSDGTTTSNRGTLYCPPITP